MNDEKHKSLSEDSRRKSSRRRILRRSGIIGACIAVAIGIAANTVWRQTDANGATAYTPLVKLVHLVQKPCLQYIEWLYREGVGQTHDVIPAVMVFVVYMALIGATLGVVVGLLIRSIKNRLVGCQTDKEPQTSLAERPQEAASRDVAPKRFKWLRLLICHLLACYLTVLVLAVVFPHGPGPIIYKIVNAPIFVPSTMVLSLFDYVNSVATWGFSIGGPSSTFIVSWICYIGSFALCYFLLRWYAKRKGRRQQN